jgi:hypothetical protein
MNAVAAALFPALHAAAAVLRRGVPAESKQWMGVRVEFRFAGDFANCTNERWLVNVFLSSLSCIL